MGKPDPQITAMQHDLVDRTLIRADDGIVARCTCGWVSRGYFTILTASGAFRDHQEAEAADGKA